MVQRIYLVRHGQTIWNHEHRYQGHTDTELSPEGIEQAMALQKRMLHENLTAAYSSDLKRAYETARIIAQPHNIDVKVCSGLREINFGVWEGLTYTDIEKNYPDLLKLWLETPHLLHVPQGESFPIVKERALKSIKEIINSNHKDDVLIVSHGGTIAALICSLEGKSLMEMWQYKQSNTSVTTLRINKGNITIESVNDVSHLQS